MEDKRVPWYKREFSLFPVNQVEVVTVVQNFSMMLESGLTVTEAVDVIADQSKGKLKGILRKMQKEIQAGEMLGDAMSHAHGIFGPVIVSSVKIGENSGTLASNLQFIAGQMEKDLALKRNIQGAMLYPSIVLSATAILGLALATFVLPQMAGIFSSLDVKLPFTTRVIIWVANVFQSYGMILSPSLLVGLIGMVVLWRQKFMQPFTHAFVLHLPFLNGFIHDVNRARFCRMLGTMLDSGVPIQEALLIQSTSLPNLVYRHSAKRMHALIDSGESFSAIIEKFPVLYPIMIQRILSVGEKSGNLSKALLYLARFYEQKVEIQAKNISSIIEPLLLLFVGLCVGFIALAIFTPIYSITNGLTA
jgi:type IV pilus assembly protein PilC